MKRRPGLAQYAIRGGRFEPGQARVKQKRNLIAGFTMRYEASIHLAIPGIQGRGLGTVKACGGLESAAPLSPRREQGSMPCLSIRPESQSTTSSFRRKPESRIQNFPLVS